MQWIRVRLIPNRRVTEGGLRVPKPVPRLASRSKRKPLTRSQAMSRIRSRDTRPEAATRAAVHRMGFRFRKHVADLPGKPDLANKKAKWAIFVHGCFWHSHENCSLASSPRTNAEYWTAKLRRNRERDRSRIEELRKLGFRVLVVWECEVRSESKMQLALQSFFPEQCDRQA